MSDEAFIPAERLSAIRRWEIGAITPPAGPAAAPPGAEAPSPAAALAAERAAARERGYHDGRAEGTAEVRTHAEVLRLVAAAASVEVRALEAQLAADVLDLALAVAKQVLRAELRVRRDAILPVVREAFAQLPHGGGASQLVLHPEDAATVLAELGDELEALGVALSEDTRTERGGCRLLTGGAEVDATLRTRWRRVVAALGSNDDWHG
jgi:flagellar assembly protein FliH